VIPGSRFLFDRVDNSQLVVFRVAFGALMALESWGAIGTGWVKSAFIDTNFTFTFIGFEWLGFLHGEIMYGYYILMGIFGILVMLGYRYQMATFMLLLMWTITYILQKSNYNNHYYLVVLMCAFMAIVPANSTSSLDVRRNDKLLDYTAPRWSLLIFKIQVTIVYFYASVAKIYPDWLRAEPVKIWFQMKSSYPVIGSFLQLDWMPYFVSYGGIVFDGLFIPALLWSKTRKWAFGVSIFFHLFNSAVFQVGIFPYMMLAISVFFFPVEEVRKLFFKKRPYIEVKENETGPIRSQKLLVSFISIYFIFQVFLPLRHHLFRGNVNWTEEGHRMSWRMMLRSKVGGIDFTLVDNVEGDTLRINPGEYLSRKQRRVIATRPDMTWQFVQVIKEEYASRGVTDISIYANSWARLNDRQSAPLIDPEADLAKVEWQPFRHSEWLTEMPGYE
jgi:hypothetical protein